MNMLLDFDQSTCAYLLLFIETLWTTLTTLLHLTIYSFLFCSHCNKQEILDHRRSLPNTTASSWLDSHWGRPAAHGDNANSNSNDTRPSMTLSTRDEVYIILANDKIKWMDERRGMWYNCHTLFPHFKSSTSKKNLANMLFNGQCKVQYLFIRSKLVALNLSL